MSFNPDVFMTRLPLLLPHSVHLSQANEMIDDMNNRNQTTQFDQLEHQSITVPLSYTLLETLNNMRSTNEDTSVAHVHALLDEIIKSPSYFFPDVPVESVPLNNLFNLQNYDENNKSEILSTFISQFLPDDNQEHFLNWKSIILQVHISILTSVDFKELSTKVTKPQFNNDGGGFPKSMKSGKSVIINEENRYGIDAMKNGESTLNRNQFTTGSITMVNQRKCVASFNSKTQIGSFQHSRIQYDMAPQLKRSGIGSGIRADRNKQNAQPMNLDINPLFQIELHCSLLNSSFKGIILAIIARGLLDKVLGNLLLTENSHVFDEIKVKISSLSSLSPSDISHVFDNYYSVLVSHAFLTQEFRESISDDIINERTNQALTKIQNLGQFTDISTVPSSRSFLESILAPLCFHEDLIIAKSAEKLYSALLNGHGWELKKTEIITCDQTMNFEELMDYVMVISAPINSRVIYDSVEPNKAVDESIAENGFPNVFVIHKGSTFQPPSSGYYDYSYGKLTSTGEIEIDSKKLSGRYIVLPSEARKEVIHELPAFDENGPIPFEVLTQKLEELSHSGVTAVHVPGVIERNICHDLMSVTDHEVFSKTCGDIAKFKEFCITAKEYQMRVLIDFLPLVSIRNSSKKYSSFGTYSVDRNGLLHDAAFPKDSDKRLLNYRSVKLWELLSTEINSLCNQCEVSGFFFGQLDFWDTVLKRDLKELRRTDPDGSLHYGMQNLIDGAILSSKEFKRRHVNGCGMSRRLFNYSPFLFKLMQNVWRKHPNTFVWMQCEPEYEPFVCNSGIIPMNYAFRTVFQKTIEHSIHCDNVDYVNANEEMISFYEARNKRNPPGSFCIAPFGAITDGPYNIPIEGLTLAIDILFYLTDVPLISGCLNDAMFFVNAYKTLKTKYEEKVVEIDTEIGINQSSLNQIGTPLSHSVRTEDIDEYDYDNDEQESTPVVTSTKIQTKPTGVIKKKTKKILKPVIEGYKWYPPTQIVVSLLKRRAGTRTKADWALGGDIHICPVSYDSHPMRAILAVARICKERKKVALICISFYMYDLIYEVGVLGLPNLQNISDDSVLEMTPLIGAEGQSTYYAVKEVTQNSSSLFLDLPRFDTSLHEIKIIESPISVPINRILNQHIYTRLERAITYSSNTILANNRIFNSILDLINEENPSEEQISKLVNDIPNKDDSAVVFREALAFATRNHKIDGRLIPYDDDDSVMLREKRAINILKVISQSKIQQISELGIEILKENELGPIMFVAPELGPFSKVGGLSTMVWELAKELAQLGLDVHCVSPYYNISPKGETGYLAKYGIKYLQTIDIYAPDKIQIGIHYGEVDGVKLWFLHHYSFFAAPYQTGSSSFKLQLLVVMAKASLEMMCQVRLIPKLIISNDWMTGLVPAIGRRQFGNTFNDTIFVHILHNLGVGYAGKIWPGDTGALYYIHQLPDEVIVDHYDNSIDPSMCALLNCHQWATVSKRYRDDLLESSPYAYILRRFREPFAYSNGIRFEERQAALMKLGMNHDEAKAYVQQKYFNFVDPNKCLFVFVGRIVEQKGVHLIIDCFEELNRRYHGAFQFIVGGQAAPDDRSYGASCTQRMWDLKCRYPQNFWADPSQFFSDGLVACHAADYTLIPSMFEPSGIVQQEAFVSGCPVIAFRTGGLADTVFEYDKETKMGNGMLFWSHQHHDYMMAIERAYNIFLDKPNYWKLRENAYHSVLTTSKVAVQWAREFARLFLKIFRNKPAELKEEEEKRKKIEEEKRKKIEEEKRKKIEEEKRKKEEEKRKEQKNADSSTQETHP